MKKFKERMNRKFKLYSLNITLLVLTISLLSNCQDNNSYEFGNYKLNKKNNIKIKLPKELNEISGLAYLEDNNIITHNDEHGVVYKIKLPSGEVINKFILGDKLVSEDFEGIAVVEDTLFLVTSSGDLYKYPGFGDENFAQFEKIKTGLNAENNVEGLCYDPDTNSLLLACKDKAGKEYKEFKAVYSFNLEKMSLENKPRFLITTKILKDKFDIKKFSPSGIELNPVSGTFFIISVDEEAIIEVSPDGKILDAKLFDSKKHKQPEGITFLDDGSLILADEGKGGKGFITIINNN
jgi:uncharacterized protein YjiK